jgi:hypothetical protein
MAFDPGRRTGIAWWKHPWQQPRFLAVDMPETKDAGIWANKFREFALPFMRMEGVTDVASESPIVVAHQKKDQETGEATGRPIIDIDVVIFHVGIFVTIQQVRAELGLPPVKRCIRSSVAKHFTSRGDGKREDIKKRFVLYCQAEGWNYDGNPIVDENIADAGGTLDYFLFVSGIRTPWFNGPRKPLFTGAAPATGANRVEERVVNQIANSAMRRAG